MNRNVLLSVPMACVAALAFAQAAPPVAPIKPVTDTYFGVTVVDPYRYMENMKDPEVAAWTKARSLRTPTTTPLRRRRRAAISQQLRSTRSW